MEESKKGFKLYLEDLVMIFVFGFTFLILAIDEIHGLKYFCYLILASLLNMFLNWTNNFYKLKK